MAADVKWRGLDPAVELVDLARAALSWSSRCDVSDAGLPRRRGFGRSSQCRAAALLRPPTPSRLSLPKINASD
jgi:hypothetical protein